MKSSLISRLRRTRGNPGWVSEWHDTQPAIRVSFRGFDHVSASSKFQLNRHETSASLAALNAVFCALSRHEHLAKYFFGLDRLVMFRFCALHHAMMEINGWARLLCWIRFCEIQLWQREKIRQKFLSWLSSGKAEMEEKCQVQLWVKFLSKRALKSWEIFLLLAYPTHSV